MGNSPICNCLINITKDKKGGNFFIDNLEDEKKNISNNNKLNNINVTNPDTSKEIPQKQKIENKLKNNQQILKNNNSSFSPLQNNISSKNNISKNQEQINKNNEKNAKKEATQDSTDIINEEKKKLKNNIEKEEKKEKEEKEEKIKEVKKEVKKQRQKIEKSKNSKTIIICGPIESGKTSFSMRYCDNKFDNCYIPSFANEISSKQLILNQGEKRLQLKFIVTNNIDDIDDVDCYFVIYDVNSNKSYYDAKKLIEDNLLTEKITIFLIGNKSDLKCVVNKKEVDDFCIKYNLYNYYISVKNNIGISSLMQKFAELFNSDDN